MKKITKKINRERRHARIRAKAFGTTQMPRLCVFKSANHIYAQLINDEKGKTLIEASDLKIKNIKASGKSSEDGAIKTRKSSIAFEVGKNIAEKAVEKKIEKVIFDRGGYQYHGRVKALADGAREGG
jgi:large subunit ribosomal protein L18